MAVAAQITELAQYLAQDAHQRAVRLERDILKLKADLAKKEAALGAARLAPKRLANFVVQLQGDYQCPRCWIEREARAPLHPVGGGTPTHDKFRCGTCDLEVTT